MEMEEGGARSECCGRPFSHRRRSGGAAALSCQSGERGRMSHTCGHTALQMEAEPSHMTEMICDLALEIIYLLTGEKHAAVKMASIEGLLRGVYPPLSVGGGLSQTPIMKPPAQSWIPESNNQKILEVTNRITVLLTGEVRGAGNSGNVEDDHFLDRIMEEQLPVTLQDGSRRRKPPEEYPQTLYTQDYTQESQEILHHHQGNDEMTIKKVKEEPQEPYMRGDEWILEKEFFPHLPKGSKQEGYSTPHHYQDENLVDVKQEQKEHVRGGEPCKEEEISPHNSTDWDIQRQPTVMCPDSGIKSDDDITSNSTTSVHLPMHCQPSECFTEGKQRLPHQKSQTEVKCFSHQSKLNLQETDLMGKKSMTCFTHQRNLTMQERVDGGEGQYSCSECGKCAERQTPDTPQQIHRAHMSSLDSECSKYFAEGDQFCNPRHPHTGGKPCSCSECGKCLSSKTNQATYRKGHRDKNKQSHMEEKPYSCPECEKCFSRLSNLKVHKKTHTGEKPYSCPECGKCFTRISSLTMHERTHTGEKPYSCPECGKCFSRLSHLTEHERTHTGEKPYSCPECGKCFSWLSSLHMHEKSHTGEKPYCCTECGKCFSQLSSLNVHKKSHTGEKPYSCPECRKCFSQLSSLNIHGRTHTGEKPYYCPKCGKRFSQLSNLTKHKRTHTLNVGNTFPS